MSNPRLDITALRERLDGKKGQQFWRGLDELADTADFRDFLEHEFPRDVDTWKDTVSRRNFLKIMGASLALAGLTGCDIIQPQEKMVPYVRPPEDVVPGQALFFATAMPLNGYGIGLLAESNMGRPTKLEGNPRHPASLGATDIYSQASILVMYDPDRSPAIVSGGQKKTWADFTTALGGALGPLKAQGARLRILTGTVTSPSLASQIQDVLAAFPGAVWHQYDPLNRDNAQAGAQLAFGSAANTVYQLDKAKVILSLDGDFLSTFPGSVRYARDFASGRRAAHGQTELNRLYVAESAVTITGTMADNRLRTRSGQVEGIARGIAAALGVSAAPAGALDATAQKWVAAVAKDLQAAGAAAVVIPGEGQPPVVHALAHAINAKLGAVGTTVVYTAPVEANPAVHATSLKELVDAINGGQVDALLILGANPVYTAPADIAFADALAKVKFSAHLGTYNDETGKKASWHVNEAYYLETWGDVRSFDGTTSLIQPLLAPLYGGKSAHELLAAALGQADTTSYELVRAYWRKASGSADEKAFETFWQTSLNDGFVANSAAAPQQPTIQAALASTPATPAPTDGIELVLLPDQTVLDGSFTNVGWLQELPKPTMLLTWDNAATLSPRTAEKLSITQNDVVQITYQGKSVTAPVWVSPGQADDTIVVRLGYGRTESGRVGTGIGYNAYSIRAAATPWFGAGTDVKKTGDTYKLVSTQVHYTMPDDRVIIVSGEAEEFKANPKFVEEIVHGEHGAPLSLVPAYDYSKYPAWAMTIDLNTCTGCNACTIACQAENNIPIVGKHQVDVGREMHWIRVDQYYFGDMDEPTVYHQPVPCMHCENAPCEIVCPVAATVHDAEGINVMVYNRCVGTRYCSNNCPYKVRRYNFLQWTDLKTEVLVLQRNPDVTVRNRGVMEKCNYCIQRINEARIAVQNAGGSSNDIPDGAILTACQQVCPTQAITFGNLNDAKSAVVALKQSPLNYSLLESLGTRPRTSYLAKIRNPNPELGKE